MKQVNTLPLINQYLIPLAQLADMLSRDVYRSSRALVKVPESARQRFGPRMRRCDVLCLLWDPLQMLFQDLCSQRCSSEEWQKREKWLQAAAFLLRRSLGTNVAMAGKRSTVLDKLLSAAAAGVTPSAMPAGLTRTTADKCDRILLEVALSRGWAELVADLDKLLECAGSARHRKVLFYQAQRAAGELAEYGLRSLARNTDYQNAQTLFGLLLTVQHPGHSSNLGRANAAKFKALCEAVGPAPVLADAVEEISEVRAPLCGTADVGERIPQGISVTVTPDGLLEVKATLKPTDRLTKEQRVLLQGVPAKSRSAALNLILGGVREARTCAPAQLAATVAELSAWMESRMPEILTPLTLELQAANEAACWKVLETKRVMDLTASDKALLRLRIDTGKF